MKSRMEKLFDLLQLIEERSGFERINRSWEDLPKSIKNILDKRMNSGIPRDSAAYQVTEIDGLTLCLAEYKDHDTGFTASYLVYGDEVLYSNES